MKFHFKRLASLISLSLSQNSNAVVNVDAPSVPINPDNLKLADLNINVSQLLAGHRSHSSHGSHRSHRSSSGNSYRAPSSTYRTPIYSPPLEPKKTESDKADSPGKQAEPNQSTSLEPKAESNKVDIPGKQAQPSNSPPPVPQQIESNKADPLGQQPRPKSSYPSTENKNTAKRLNVKEARKNVIMRVQLALQFEGYYDGPIDGTLGPETRKAIDKYKKIKGLTGIGYMDTETLNSLGIKGF